MVDTLVSGTSDASHGGSSPPRRILYLVAVTSRWFIMGFRYSRRIKILPGVSLNLGKRGYSISVGPKGMRTTINPNTGKAHFTAGTPIKGLSYTHRINLDEGRTSTTRTMNNAPIHSIGEYRKLTAFLLCFMGGLFGLHRFYVGRTISGIFYLFTAGVFGLGWIIDILSIMSGTFLDKNEQRLH